MSLMLGSGPFGDRPAGTFNFRREGPSTVLYWEDFPKRVRVELGSTTIADSTRVKALHETGRFLTFYFPPEDVDMERLIGTDRTSDEAGKGTARYWSVEAGGKVAENAAWSYTEPADLSPIQPGYIAFEYGKMDAWYQEEDHVYGHPRDPYHRFDIHRSSRRVVVRHEGEVIAESVAPMVLFETGLPPRYYLRPAEVRSELLQESDRVTHCAYKGPAQHWHLRVGAAQVRNAAWTLIESLGEAREIEGFFCFYPEKVEVEVDGEIV